MTTQRSSLRVTADLDASGYKAGADQKVAADNAMAASSRAAGATIADTATKVSQAGNVLEQLSRRYVDGYGTMQKFNSELGRLSRGIDTGNVSIQQAGPILDGMYRKYGLAADASGLLAKGQTELAAMVSAANARIEAQATALSSASGAYQVHIAQLKAVQAAETGNQVAAANQNKVNAVLGVRAPSSASSSATVFQAEFDRLDEIAKQKAVQVGQNFSAELDQRLASGTGKSARDAAAAFTQEMDRLEQIAAQKAEQIGSNFQADLNASFGIGSKGYSAQASASVFQDAARASDAMAARATALRAELDPASAAQGRLNTEISGYKELAAAGAISSEELAAGVALANGRFSAAKPAVEGHSSALGIGNTQTMALTHSMRSFIEQMAMGIPVTQAAVSELNHMSYAMAGEDGVLAALKKAGPGLLASILTPTGAIITGFGALAVAAGAYYLLTRQESKSLADLLKEERQAIDDVAKAYDLAKVSADSYSKSAGLYAESAARKGASDLSASTRSTDIGTLNSLAQFVVPGYHQSGHYEARSQFSAFNDVIQQYAKGVGSNNPDYDALAKGVHDVVVQNPELQVTGDKILNIAKNGADAHGQMKEVADTLARINSRAPSLVDSQLGRDYREQNDNTLTWLQRQNKAAMDNIGATSPEERRQAAIDAEAAKPSPDGQSAEVTQYKINAAGALAYAQALNSLEVAQEQNRRQLDQTIASAKTNLDLVGKSTAEIEAQKMETSELAKVREDAARNGIDDEKQFQAIYGETIAKIKETAAEYGKLIALEQARQTISTQKIDLETQQKELSLVGDSKLAHDREISALKTEQDIRKLGIPLYGEEANAMRANTAAASANADALAKAQFQQKLLFDRQQIFRNADDQQIASALQGAGLPVDLNSQEAQMMRYNMALQETKDTFKGFFSDMQSSLEQGKSLWESFGDAAKNALTKIADKLLDRSLDTIFNSLFGGQSGSTGSNGGGLLSQLFNFGGSSGSSQQSTPTGGASSFLGKLFGGGGSQSVGSMQVQAAVVNVNGGIGSGIPGLGGAANDNNGGGLFGWLGSLFGGSGSGSTGTGASQATIQNRIDQAFGTASSGLGGIFSPASGFASSTSGVASALSLGGGSVTDMIRRAASAEGINPDIFLQVAKSEGGLSGFTQSNVFKNGIQEPSFGPMQLLKGGPGTGFQTGLGNAFQQQTGLDPADPANMEAGINFAAQQAKQSGWGQWYGAKAAGIGNWEGINRGADGIDPATTQSIAKLGAASSEATSSIGSLGSGASSLLSSVGGAAGDATKGLGQFSSALNQFPAAPSGGGGGGGGLFGWLGSLFGGGGGGGGALSPEASSLLQSYPDGGGLFDSGGYTGPGGRKEAAGIVHRGEVVWSQDDISRAGGVHVVEGMRRGYAGYADGGIVRSRMRYDGASSPRQSAPSAANDRPAQNIQQTNNFIFKENPAAPASQNQIAAKSARALERLTRTS